MSSVDTDEEFNDDTLWETELEIALLTKCDYGTIRSISKLRPIPESLRSKVWKICLDVQQDVESNSISKWKEVFDLPQQDKIREDCKSLAEKLHPEDKEQQFFATSQLESIITFYCKTNDEFYEKDNGWIEILHPIMTLHLNKNETFNFFSAILKRYIPKDCVRNGSPYHLFRLLMLYHDPELCAYLDTKKVPTDSYAHLWFRSLFAAIADPKVALHLWDIYFQLGDQFLIFFMSLILIYNMREEILASNDKERADLIKIIQNSPTTISIEDLLDFNSLCQLFGTRTPQSFRKEYKKSLFEGVSLERKASSIYQALCLPVSVDELLQANQLGSGGVRYFIIDCRPADKYNASHYATAFHLDANLMLENQAEFNQSVEALLAAQKQAIDSGSVAGGQHLCFMGAGNDEDDKYVNMVVSNFLQRKINYVSLALGGYEKLKETIEDPEMIVGTDINANNSQRAKFTEEWVQKLNTKTSEGSSLFNKFSSVLKIKSFDLKDKVKDYINTSLTPSQSSTSIGSPNTTTSGTSSANVNSKKIATNLNQLGKALLSQTSKIDYSNLIQWPSQLAAPNSNGNNGHQNHHGSEEKHVSSSDKIGKLYRNQGNLFAIDDDDDENENAGGNNYATRNAENEDENGSSKNSQEHHQPEMVNLKVWLERADVLNKFKCFYREKVLVSGSSPKKNEWVPGYLLLTKTHLYGLTQSANASKNKNGMVKIAVRHPLSSVIKIATKSSCPEIISFTYGEKLSGKVKASGGETSENNENEEEIKREEDGGEKQPEYDIKGKDWFFIPDYAGEAASAVKMQILELVDLVTSTS